MFALIGGIFHCATDVRTRASIRTAGYTASGVETRVLGVKVGKTLNSEAM